MKKRTYDLSKFGLLCLAVLFILTGCQVTPPTEEISVDKPCALELMDYIEQPLVDLMPYLGDIVTIEADEMDGSPVVVFDLLRVRYHSKEEKIVGYYLDKAWLDDFKTFSVAGVTFDLNNAEVLELLGNPINGNRQLLTYSEDFNLWWKYTFNDQDQLEFIRVFYGKDQGDRVFVDWRKS
jgi:hypothetical protein